MRPAEPLGDLGQRELAEQAAKEGASYVAFGRFFNSNTKPGAPFRTVAQLIAAAKGRSITYGSAGNGSVNHLLGEMFNNRIRSAALGLAAAAQWLANFAVSTAFPPMAEFSLTFTYGFYAVSALLSLLFVAKFIPETNGRSLEDM